MGYIVRVKTHSVRAGCNRSDVTWIRATTNWWWEVYWTQPWRYSFQVFPATPVYDWHWSVYHHHHHRRRRRRRHVNPL